MSPSIAIHLALALLLLTPPAPLHAQQWGVAARQHINWGGPKSRAGDIQGYGVSLRRALGTAPQTPWEIALILDHLEYDLETPVHATGVEPRAGDEPVDQFTTVWRGQVELVRRLRMGHRWTPFLTAGAGIYAIDVPDVTGNTAAGGTFELRTESPTTAGLSVGVGSEWRLWRNISFALGFSYAQTFTKYEVTEVRSGATGTISPFAPLGVGSQLIVRW